MRYWNVPDATFTDWNGVPQAVKDVREITMAAPPVGQKTAKFRLAGSCLGFQFISMKTINAQGSGTFLDEIASRPDVYGEKHEGDAYLIFEMNMDLITSQSFDFAVVRSLVIPRKESW